MDVGNRNDWQPELVVPSRELAARISARWPIAAAASATIAARWRSAMRSTTAAARSASSPRSRSRSAATARARACPPTASSIPACSQRTGTTCAMRCAPAPATRSCCELIRAHLARRTDRYSELRDESARAGGQPEGRDVLHRRLSHDSFSHLDARAAPDAWSTSATKPRPSARATPRRACACPPRSRAALRDSGTAHQEGTGLRYRHRRRRDGREAHPRAHSLLPSARARELPHRDRARGRAARDSLHASSVHHNTGVEMEALTGASVAALTVYDMCKALSHDIVISDVRLLAKTAARRARGRTASMSRARLRPGARRAAELAHAARQGGARYHGQDASSTAP